MKSFSVLTVSKRIGWEDLAVDSVKHQTVKPEQWVIVTEDTPDWIFWKKVRIGCDIHLVKAPAQTRLSNLNASLNQGLSVINTDYVVFYQDFIKLQEDCFEKLLNLAGENTFVTTCTPNYDGSNDSRYLGVDVPRNCRPEEWEANVAIAPMGLIKEMGGFDERLDDGWSWDNALLARKAAMLGAKFIIDESNRPKLLPHEMKSREGMPLNGELCERIIQRIRNGEEPINCGCL